jgi:hypothetical protein
MSSQNNKQSRKHPDHTQKPRLPTPLTSTQHPTIVGIHMPLFPTHSPLSLLFPIHSFIHSLTYSVPNLVPLFLIICLFSFPPFSFSFLFFSFLSHMSHDDSSMTHYDSHADLSLLRLLTPIVTHPNSYSRIPLYINVCS